MRILVLGADGMLGHQLVESLRARHEVIGTVRNKFRNYDSLAAFLPASMYYEVEASDFAKIQMVIRQERPDVVVNAVGIVKQRAESKASLTSIETNALLPHRLALACLEVGSRLLHISTDCVFSGRQGMYTESDFPDADDLYGRSKLLGEVSDPGCMTLRTSIIGLELSRKKSLVEWFLSQTDPIAGFRRAIYTGFTTLEMARIVERVLVRFPTKYGMFHVSSDPIDKFTLLCKLRDRLGRDIEIRPEDEFSCDRSLVSKYFREEFSYVPPTWDEMIDELGTQIEVRYS